MMEISLITCMQHFFLMQEQIIFKYLVILYNFIKIAIASVVYIQLLEILAAYGWKKDKISTYLNQLKKRMHIDLL